MLAEHKYWIFDMDGTLTLGMHDFEAIRRELGIPAKAPILEALEQMPARRKRDCQRRLHQLEMALAHKARPQPGVFELLDSLVKKGCRLGILTRNGEDIAAATLSATGLLDYFDQAHIIGRNTCAPKPLPDGVLHLLELWQAPKSRTVMVGDYLYDIQAGFEAGVTTVHFDPEGSFPWPEYSHYRAPSLGHIRALLSVRF